MNPLYFFKEAFTNLKRNLLMTSAASLTAAISLILLGGVLALDTFVQGLTTQIEEGVEVQVVLKDDITDVQRDELRAQLEDIEIVKRVNYVSPEQALAELKEWYPDKPVITQNLTEDSLPALFRVSLDDPKRSDVIIGAVEDNPAVDDIEANQDIVDKLVGLVDVVRRLSFVMIAVLVVAAVLLISNTIQIGIFARRKEVEIMKLVGATNFFVRTPFVIEGIVAGLIGAVVAIGVLAVAIARIKAGLPVFLPTPYLVPSDMTRAIVITVCGAGVGAIGSALAVRRYLRG